MRIEDTVGPAPGRVAREIIQRPRLPGEVGILLCVLIGFAWWVLDNQRQASLQRLVQSSAIELSSIISGDIRARIPAIERTAGRWAARGGTPRDEFALDALAYIEDLPGFQALGWVDESFYVRWIVPYEGNEEAENFFLAAEEKRRIALETARDLHEPTMTGLVDLVQGGKGLVIYFPLLAEGEFDGFISAVFRVEGWLNYVFSLRAAPEYRTDFVAAVEIDGEQVYVQPGWNAGQQTGLQALANFELMGLQMEVVVQPTARFFQRHTSYVPEIVAAIGILLSILVVVLVHLYQRAGGEREGAVALSGALRTEVGERKLAQDKLAFARDRLEERVAERTAELKNAVQELQAEVEERHRAEESAEVLRKQLTRASRLSVIGEMATNLAHEINQPLTAIAGFAHVCIRFLRGDKDKIEETISNLERIEEQAIRAGEIISWMREAIRKDATGRNSLQVNTCIREIGDLMASDFTKQRASLIYDLGDDLPMIRANKLQVQQVIVNLLQNSLSVAGENEAGQHQVTVRTSLSGDGAVLVSVEDNGPGVPAEIRDEIFSPWASNRKDGLGLGLGLSVSQSIVESHGGRLWLDTEFEDGAAFRITFPAFEETS